LELLYILEIQEYMCATGSADYSNVLTARAGAQNKEKKTGAPKCGWTQNMCNIVL